ncbi:MAG: GGDEF domain-containing protein [Desulfobulbaceae bacterium]|nr:GGDEF domain-containing protein [Desulfobulbaceae bacterium]
MFLFPKTKSWSLRDKFKAVFTYSLLAALIFVSIGFWRFALFNRNKTIILESSSRYQSELANNFDITQTIGEIQADLVSFIQTASHADLEKIKSKAQLVLANLPPNKKQLLTSLLTQVSDLETQLSIFRTNNDKALSAGNTILSEIEKTGSCGGNKLCQEALLAIGQAYRNSHPKYFDVILSGNDKDLAQARTEINNVMEDLDNHLYAIGAKLSNNQNDYLRRITALVYEQDQAITTVIAVKQKVLDIEKEINRDLRQAEKSVAATSVGKSQDSAALMTQALNLASNYALLMFLGVIVVIILLMVLGWTLSRTVVTPLVLLVSLLKKFSQIIASVGRQNEEDENFERLNTLMAHRDDEIGDVVRATKELMDRMQAISAFRQKIEVDSSVDEVFFRLARVFSLQLSLGTFVIYEVNAENTLVRAYCSPPELEAELPEFYLATDCRCKRTGTVVSSLTDPEICRVCLLDNVVHFFCVPILVGGSVIGVVQFLLPFSKCRTNERQISERLIIAQNYIAEAQPVIEAKRSARRLEEMATTDQLTGLFNRRYLEISLQQVTSGIKRRNTTLGVLLCDIDLFKQVNDTYGHDAGDIVLAELAAILLQSVRTADLVIRFGGEEFLILLMDAQRGAAIPVAEKIRAKVESHLFHLAGVELNKTISIGISEFPDGEQQSLGIWEIIKQADIALYHAKDNGRNRVVQFTRDMGTDHKL